MNNLIPIQTNESQEPVVNGRDLHEFLNVGTPYDKWFPRMCEYGFELDKDFSTFLSESTGGRPSTEHLIKLDMAKELCMLARSDKGKQARHYFIQIEKEYNSPEKVMARALIYAQQKLSTLEIKAERQEQQLIAQAPHVRFAKAVESTDNEILIRDLAKIIAQNGIDIGEKRLFNWLRMNNYLTLTNKPTQRSIDLGVMVITECVITIGGSSKVAQTTKITGKGQTYFVNKFLKKEEVVSV